MALQASSDLYNNSKSVVNFRHTKNTEIHKTLGKGWFNAQPLELDDAVKRDLKVIQLRNYLDPKR